MCDDIDWLSCRKLVHKWLMEAVTNNLKFWQEYLCITTCLIDKGLYAFLSCWFFVHFTIDTLAIYTSAMLRCLCA